MEQKSPFFSIIIPVYNGMSRGLPQCLASIWNQPLEDRLYEVLCVDDGSTDGTRDWLGQEAGKHSNCRCIFHETNLRQGGARNRGVEQARGAYLLFLDMDDYYHPGALARIYRYLSRHSLDILVLDSAYQYRGHESGKLQLNLKNQDCMTGEAFAQNIGFLISPWRLCTRRAFYVEHGFQFPERVQIEDVDWAVRITYYAQRMQYKPFLAVHYNKDETGITDTMYRDESVLADQIRAANRVMALSDTLYRESPARSKVIDVADRYYNNSCKALLGLRGSPGRKRELIGMIAPEAGRRFFVRLALKHRDWYSRAAAVTPPLYRFCRRCKRTLEARTRQGTAHWTTASRRGRR